MELLGRPSYNQYSKSSLKELTWIYFIEEIFIFVHPDFHNSLCVMVNDASYTPRPGVGGGLSEDMTHSGAGYDEHFTTTHPHLKIKILA